MRAAFTQQQAVLDAIGSLGARPASQTVSLILNQSEAAPRSLYYGYGDYGDYGNSSTSTKPSG